MPPEDDSTSSPGWFGDFLFQLGLLGSQLRDINISQDTVDAISRVIRESSDTLENRVDGVDTGPLSGCGGAEVFAANANLAREHQVKGLSDMRSGLTDYDDAVQRYHRGQQDVDAANRAGIATITQQVDNAGICVTGPTQGTTSACTPTTGG